MFPLKISWKETPTSRIIYCIQVALQLIAALAAIGLNAFDIEYGSTNTGASVYAIGIGCLSALTASLLILDIFFPIPSRLWLLWSLIWQWVLTLAWSGVCGTFGAQYFGISHATRVSVAAGFSFANLLLWFVGSIVGTIMMCLSRKRLGPRQLKDSDTSHELT